MPATELKSFYCKVSILELSFVRNILDVQKYASDFDFLILQMDHSCLNLNPIVVVTNQKSNFFLNFCISHPTHKLFSFFTLNPIPV